MNVTRWIHGFHASTRDACAAEIDEHQARPAAAARQHDGEARGLTVRDRHLCACKLSPESTVPSFEPGVPVGPLRNGERADRFARHELRQPSLLLRVRAEAADRLRREAH